MAIAIDASTPAYKAYNRGTTSTWTTDSFSPPAGSLIVLVATGNQSLGAVTYTPSTSVGAGDVFTSQVTQSTGGQGKTQIWTCPVSSGGTSRTLSISVTGSNNEGQMKAYVLTGADTGNPMDTSGQGTSATNNLTANACVTSVDGCWVFGGATEYQDLGLPTSTDEEDAFHGSNVDTITVRKSTTSSAGTVTLNFDAGGTGTPTWNWAAIAIRDANAPVVLQYIGTSNIVAGTATAAITAHASTATDDLLIFYHYSAVTGGDETVDTGTAGFTDIYNVCSGTYGLIAAAYRIRQAGDSTYTFAVTNHSTGTTGETLLQWVETYRATDAATPIGDDTGSNQIAAHTTNVGPISATGITSVPVGGLLIVHAGRHDDLATISQTTLSGDSLTWSATNVQESTTGADAAMFSQRGLNATAGELTSFTDKTIVTPATPTSATGQGGMFVIRPVSGAEDYTETPTDSAGVTDSVTVVKDIVLSFTDGAGVTDGTVTIGWDIAAADYLAPADTPTIETGKGVTAADAMGLTDAVTLDRSLLVTDSAGVTDTIATLGAFVRTPTDSMGLTDSVTVVTSFSATATDTEALTDSQTFARGPGATDGAGLGDSVTVELTRAVTQTDAEQLTDTVALEQGLTVTDQAAPADTVTTLGAFIREPIDDAGLVDSYVTEKTGSNSLDFTDLAGLTDSIALTRTVFLELADTIAVYDTTRAVDHTLEGVEDTGLADTFTAEIVSGAQAFTETPTHTMGLTDTVEVSLGIVLAPTDQLALTDTTEVEAGQLVAQTDQLALTDSVTLVRSVNLAPTDDVGVTDSHVEDKTGANEITFTDPAGLTDSVTLTRTVFLDFADTTSPTDVPSLGPGLGVTDTEQLTDAATLGTELARTDSAGVTDTATRDLGKNPTDTEPLTDTTALDRGLSQTDSMGLADTAATQSASFLTPTDSAGLTDSVTVEGAGSINVTDVMGLTDSSTVQAGRAASPTDSAGLTDSVKLDVIHVVTDNAGVTDTVTLTWAGIRDLIDGTGLTDTAFIDLQLAFVPVTEQAVVLKTNRTSSRLVLSHTAARVTDNETLTELAANPARATLEDNETGAGL